jgi:tetratricopeptide (TPR) repeat protein
MNKKLTILLILFFVPALFCCGSAEKETSPKSSVQKKNRAFNKRFEDPIINLVVYNGWTHYLEGRYENAQNDFERLMSTGNSHYDVSFGAGMSCFMQKNYNKAVYYFSRCLSQKESHFEALFYRGESYKRKGDFLLAVKDYNRIIAMNSSDEFFCGSLISDFASAALLETRKAEVLKKIGEIR